MDKFNFSFENIAKGDGLSISFTGMLIVFAALTLIAVFIAILPWVMKILSPILPKGMVDHGAPAPRPVSGTDEKILAAIGYAMYKKHSGS